jgi:hypothetical protein
LSPQQVAVPFDLIPQVWALPALTAANADIREVGNAT